AQLEDRAGNAERPGSPADQVASAAPRPPAAGTKRAKAVGPSVGGKAGQVLPAGDDEREQVAGREEQAAPPPPLATRPEAQQSSWGISASRSSAASISTGPRWKTR